MHSPQGATLRRRAPQGLRHCPSRAPGGPCCILGPPLSVHSGPTLTSLGVRAGWLAALTHGLAEARAGCAASQQMALRYKALRLACREKFAFPRTAALSSGLRKPFARTLSSETSFAPFFFLIVTPQTGCKSYAHPPPLFICWKQCTYPSQAGCSGLCPLSSCRDSQQPVFLG